MPRIMHRKASLALAVVTLACNTEPDDLREWMPTDHEHSTVDTSTQTPDTSNSAAHDPAGLDEVIIVTWRRNCATCHGPIGRGDGPQGAMVKARDLTDPTWQASVTDEQLKAVIVQGRGSMPAFQLPENTVQGLVRLIRLLNMGARASQTSAADRPPSEEESAERDAAAAPPEASATGFQAPEATPARGTNGAAAPR